MLQIYVRLHYTTFEKGRQVLKLNLSATCDHAKVLRNRLRSAWLSVTSKVTSQPTGEGLHCQPAAYNYQDLKPSLLALNPNLCFNSTFPYLSATSYQELYPSRSSGCVKTVKIRFHSICRVRCFRSA